jgi:hypothetical protein
VCDRAPGGGETGGARSPPLRITGRQSATSGAFGSAEYRGKKWKQHETARFSVIARGSALECAATPDVLEALGAMLTERAGSFPCALGASRVDAHRAPPCLEISSASAFTTTTTTTSTSTYAYVSGRSTVSIVLARLIGRRENRRSRSPVQPLLRIELALSPLPHSGEGVGGWGWGARVARGNQIQRAKISKEYAVGVEFSCAIEATRPCEESSRTESFVQPLSRLPSGAKCARRGRSSHVPRW